jgi:hypothetical protein
MAIPELGNASEQLSGTEGYTVETAEGPLGHVEEVWLGPHDEPLALAVRTTDGRRALLLGEQVRTVERDYRWVVTQPWPALLELDAPRLASASGEGGRRIVARWQTTGAPLLAPVPRPLGPLSRLLAKPAVPAPSEPAERSLWQVVAILYGALALIVAIVIALAFLIPWLVTGAAY